MLPWRLGPQRQRVLPSLLRTFFLQRHALSKMIGFSQPDTTAAVWQVLMAGAKQEAAKRGYTLLESHANSQLDAQLSEIETWIGEGVSGIIVLPLDNNAIEPLVVKAHKAGIKMLDYSDDCPTPGGRLGHIRQPPGRLLGRCLRR